MVVFRAQNCRRLITAIVLLLGSGCASRDCPVCEQGKTLASSQRATASGASVCGDDFKPASRELSKTIADEGSVDILLLSGGGWRGSFGAGMLDGWRESSPRFDMVTGVSTGAIIATWAYLGPGHATDPYARMERTYGGHTKKSEMISRRWLFPFVDSKYTLAPLKKLFREVLPEEMIIAVGREYDARGRQLWIGSTNVETGQFCHWNLTERAKAAATAKDEGNQAEVDRIVDNYYDLIIASSANPTVFKPVEIDGYIHVDGGVSETIYIERLNRIADDVLAERRRGVDKPLNVYAVINGKLVTSQKCVDLNLASLAVRSISLVTKSATRGNLDRIQVVVDEGLEGGRWSYHTARIDDNMKLDPADDFNEKPMGDLYRYGKSWIEHGGRWCEGVPSPYNKEPNCTLPRVGQPSCH